VDVAPARRLGRPSWVNLRTVLGLLLFSASLLGGQRILAASETSDQMWVAARDLPEGAVVASGDVELAAVSLPSRLSAAYAGAGESLTGTSLTRPVRAGELVATAWLAAAPGTSPGRSMTIPVEPEHAVGGALQPGDRVDVLATFDAGNVRARTLVLARAVEVLDVVETGALAFGENTLVGITLAVGPEQATRLAFASRTGEIDVARVDGPTDRDVRAATVRASDFP
jgi:pilus assembly protein CpaB